MLAVAALAFVGCSKEIDLQKSENTLGTHTVTFKVEKTADTRTEVVEEGNVANYYWSAKDDQYFHVYENGKEATEIAMSVSDDNKIATITATFADTDTTAFSYTAVYGNQVSNAGNPLIPDSQSPVTTSFDPAADVLVSAEPITLEGNAAAGTDTEFLFKLKRVVSINKMTLKGMEAGEVVKTVELISTDGYFSARYILSSDSYNNQKKSLTFDYTALDDAVVGSDGTFPVYFTSAPVSGATFSVKVTTDKNVYLRDDFTSKLTLEVGKFRRFGINLEGYGEAISEGTDYVIVKAQDGLFSGATYILVGTTYTLGGQKTNNRDAVSITDNDGVVNINNEIDAYPIVIEAVAGGYTMKDVRNNKYLYTNSTSANRLLTRDAVGTDNYAVWNISITNGIASITNVGNTARGILCFNPNNGSPMFAAYGTIPTTYGGTADLALYVDESTCVELEDPELSFSATEVTVAWEDLDDFEAPVLSNPHNLDVNYTSSDPDVATVAADGKITFVGNGITTITASSEKTEIYNAGSAQYTLKVTGAPTAYDFTTVAELNSLAASTAKEVVGTLTGAVVSFAPDSKNAVIKDATGSVLVYVDNHGLLQGQTYTGEVSATVKAYNNAGELTAITAAFTGEEAFVSPESVTLTDLVGHFAQYQNAYVSVEGLTVTTVSGKNINVTDGTNTYVVYESTGTISVAPGDVISVVGTVAQYSNKDQVKVWSEDDLTITQPHTQTAHVITYSQPNEGGSFTVKVGGTTVENGAELDEGTTVTLTATAATGYTFSGWTVTGATVSGNTATETFTVGTSDVNITASFTSNSAVSESVDFTQQGYSNQQEITSYSGTDFSVTFDKGTNNNAPKYYTTGTAIRVYGSNSFTVSSSSKTIAKIELTFGSSDGSNEITTDVASYANGTWTGESSSVTFTVGGTSGNRRLSAIKVTFK